MSKKILLVDDEKDILTALKELLEMEGFIIYCATNGKEGINVFKETAPDLIIVDMMMPIMNGAQMVENIRLDSINPEVPIIMMSSVVSLVKIENPRWDAFIRKPSGFDDILNIINKLLIK